MLCVSTKTLKFKKVHRYTKCKIGHPRKYFFLNVFNHSFILMTMLTVVLKKWKIQIFLCTHTCPIPQKFYSKVEFWKNHSTENQHSPDQNCWGISFACDPKWCAIENWVQQKIDFDIKKITLQMLLDSLGSSSSMHKAYRAVARRKLGDKRSRVYRRRL